MTTRPGAVLMWEVRAAPGRLPQLVDAVRAGTHPTAAIYASAEPDERVVVIDPTGQGPGQIPDELVARPPHEWTFDVVARP
jgi:hypothetical protein